MKPSGKVFFLILIIIPVFTLPGTAQDPQDAFATELIAACKENDIPQLQSLIKAHRLWVKPVVNSLIGEYIEFKLAGKESDAESTQLTARLIALTFQDAYGEKSLAIGTGYLDSWDKEDLQKKAEADKLYSQATDLRIGGQQPEEAIVTYLAALTIYEDLGDVRGQGEVLGGLGYIYFSIDTDTCLSYYQEALLSRQSADDRYLVGGTLNTLGLIYYSFFYDLEKSIEYFEKAAVVREEIGYWSGLGGTLSILGEVYTYNGEPGPAISSFEKSYHINEKAGNQSRMSEAKLHSGTLLIRTGRYPEALANLQVSLELAQEISDTLLLGDVHVQLAMAYAYLGDYDTAIKHASGSFTMYEAIDDLWGLAGAYNNTGFVLHDVGRIQKAAEYYEKSLEIYTELGDQEHILILSNNLGTLEFDLGKYKEAEEYHEHALQISKEIPLESGELSSLLNLANTQNRLGKLTEALGHYDSALLLSRDLSSPETEWKIMVGIGETYKLLGDYSKAIEYNEKGLNIIEGLRNTLNSEEYRSSYLARERYAFEDVIHMLGELHEADPDKEYDLLAFEYAQRCKSRSFLDQMENTDLVNSGGGIRISTRVVSLKEVQESGIEDNVIMEYSLGDSSSYLWVITPDRHKMIKLPGRKSLQEQVETFKFAILNPMQDNKAFLQQSGYILYKHLIQSAEPYISKGSKLVILSDGVLNYVPFQVLITDPPDQKTDQSYKELSYLVKKYPISYGQSSSVLINLIKERQQEADPQLKLKDLIAFGDPVYTDSGSESDMTRPGFKRLKHSGMEVESISEFFKDGMADIYLRENASEENIKLNNRLSDYRYIHFACHGLVDEKNPENSSLVLSQNSVSAEDGFFQASEISGLTLNADLAVLSACQTGLGKLIRGEGMIGLSRSFMYAGTPSVVVSLWSVSDISTSILMRRFYENLTRKGLSKTDALHLAQISMIKDEKYAHPFFWAPFILTGDWQ